MTEREERTHSRGMLWVPASLRKGIAMGQSCTADGPAWVRNLDDAKTQARTAGKDLLICFTGHGWCAYCKFLDDEVFQSSAFVTATSTDFICVELDFYFGESPGEKTREESFRALQEDYLVRGFPTVVLADADGVPFAIQTGYTRGTGPEESLAWVRDAQTAKAQRDRSFEAAKSLPGSARAQKLDRGISCVESLLGSIEEREDDPVLVFYADTVQEILSLSSDEEDGLSTKYRSRQKARNEWQSRVEPGDEVFAKLEEFNAAKDYAGAIEFIAGVLDAEEDEETRWRLESARQTFLEWSKRHDEALTNCRRLLDLPDLAEHQRDHLLDREAFNLFCLGRIDEALAQYDRQIAAADDNPRKRLHLLEWKARMIRDRGRLQESIEIGQAYRHAAERGTDAWAKATALLIPQLREAGRHEEVLKLVDEYLKEDQHPWPTPPGADSAWLSLEGAESHIGLGNDTQARKLVAEAESLVQDLSASERYSERRYVERLNDRVEGLLQAISGK